MVVVMVVVVVAAERWLRGVAQWGEGERTERRAGLCCAASAGPVCCPALGPSRRPQSLPAVATVKVGRPLSDFLSFSLLLSTQSTQLRETAPPRHSASALSFDDPMAASTQRANPPRYFRTRCSPVSLRSVSFRRGGIVDGTTHCGKSGRQLKSTVSDTKASAGNEGGTVYLYSKNLIIT